MMVMFVPMTVVMKQLGVFIPTIPVMIQILALKIGVMLNKDVKTLIFLVMMEMTVPLIAVPLMQELPILL
jgi:hypothetical protein